MNNVVEVINNISESAKPRQKMRVIKSIAPGQYIRQGDIYLIRLGKSNTQKVFASVSVELKDFTAEVKSNKQYFQLVPGSTMGSRHQVKSQDVKLFVNPMNPSPLVGPIIKADASFDLVHPEHAHFNLPSGDYLVCYQLNAKTQKRVKD